MTTARWGELQPLGFPELLDPATAGSLREGVREALRPDLGDISDAEADAYLMEAVSDMSPGELEGFFQSVGSFLKKAGGGLLKSAGTLLPIAGGAIGTLFGGPVGTAIGTKLGGLAGGLLGRAVKPRPRRRRVVGPPRRAASPVPAGGSSAAAQLLALLQNPALLQSLLGRVLQGSGKAEVATARGAVPVPFEAFMNTLESLAVEATREAQSEGYVSSETPDYLLDAQGDAEGGITLPEQRARTLLEMLEQSAALESAQAEAEDVAGWLEQAGILERIA